MKVQELEIEAGRTERLYWQDLWQYRELFYFLAWRDILVRYKQTVIGAAWALLRPFLTMVVFSVVFGKLAKLPSEGVPYPILVFAAMLPWQFFFQFAFRMQQQSDSQRQSALQGLFSASGGADQRDCGQFCRFFDFGFDIGSFNGLVQLCSDLAYIDAAIVDTDCLYLGSGQRFVAGLA